MSHYANLAIIALRIFGLLIMLYAVPMFLYATAWMLTTSPPRAAEGANPLGWLLYGIVGIVLFVAARPLGRLAARAVDPSALSDSRSADLR